MSGFKLIYPGCAIHSAGEAHVSFKWNVGSYVGQERGGRREAVEGPQVFVSAGSHSNIDFQSHMVLFVTVDTRCAASVG